MKLKRMFSLGLSLVMASSTLSNTFAVDLPLTSVDIAQAEAGDTATSDGAVAAMAVDEEETLVAMADTPYAVEGGNIYYNKNGLITGCDDTVTSANIPAEIDGVTITGIGSRAFRNCANLTTVVIPEGVTSIAVYAFQNCSGLTSITLPGTLTGIGDSAFDKCVLLTDIVIPEGVTKLGSSTFRDCSALKNVTLPDTLTQIGGAFTNCTGLTEINIPDSVTEIGNGAFKGCTALESVHMPANLTKMGNSAFESCSSLKSVSIPAGVTEIPSYAFRYCTGLTDITGMPAGVTIQSAAFEGCTGLTTISGTGGVGNIATVAFKGCSKLTGIAIAGGSTVASRAFENCSQLVTVDSPQGLGNISDLAFSGCSKLTRITIADGTTVGSSAFSGCSSMTEVNGVIGSLGKYAFQGCSSLTTVSISDTVKTIEAQTFEGCSSLVDLTIPQAVTSIGSSAFKGCSSLKSIRIPDGVTTINDSTFEGCAALESVDLPAGVTDIGISAFSGCAALKVMAIPENVTTIGNSAFYYCKSMTEVILPDSLTTIGDSAFYGCSALTAIAIPAGVTSIGTSLFQNCTGLTGITLPDGVTVIGEKAFTNCRSLKELTIPVGVTSLTGTMFKGCSGLTKLTVLGDVPGLTKDLLSDCVALADINIGEANSSYKSADGAVLNKAGDKLIFCPPGKVGTYTIPDGVLTVGESAFNGCTLLTEIIVPEGVVVVEDYAFDKTGVTEVITLPSTITDIGYHGISNIKVVKLLSGGIKNMTADSLIDAMPYLLKGSYTEIKAKQLNMTYGYIDEQGNIIQEITVPSSDIEISRTISASAGTQLSSGAIYLKIVPKAGVNMGEKITFTLENATFSKDNIPVYKSGANHTYDEMITMLDAGLTLDDVLKSNLGYSSPELPYRMTYEDSDTVTVELFAIDAEDCGKVNNGVSGNIPYYYIPICATVGLSNVRLNVNTTGTGLGDEGFSEYIVQVDESINRDFTEYDVINLSKIAKVEANAAIDDVYLKVVPQNGVSRGDTITITLDSGTFDSTAMEAAEYVSAFGNSYDNMMKGVDAGASEYNVLTNNLGSISCELPYKVVSVYDRQIKVELFPIDAQYCGTDAMTYDIPYYYIPLKAIAGTANINVSVNTLNVSLPQGFTSLMAVVGDNAYSVDEYVGDRMLAVAERVAKGGAVDSAYVYIAPEHGISQGDTVTLKLRNGTFDKAAMEAAAYVSASGKSYDDMMELYNQGYPLVQLLYSNLEAMGSCELPYKVVSVTEDEAVIRLFPVKREDCGANNNVATNRPYYYIPVRATAGNYDMTVSVVDVNANLPWGFEGVAAYVDGGTPESTSETTTESTTAVNISETTTEVTTEGTTESITGIPYPMEGGNIYYDTDGRIIGSDSGVDINEIPFTMDGTKANTIGDSAFAGNTNLTDVNILSNITTIGDEAFKDCTNLTSISLTGSVTSISDTAFEGTALKSVEVIAGTYGEAWAKEKGYEVVYRTFLYGDANYDTILGAQDAANILQKVLDNSFLTGMDKNGGNTSLYLDTNGDGVLGAQDAAITLQKVLDNSYRMPCELK